MVFQDPYASLNPRMRVGDILAEGMRALNVGGDEAGRAARIDVLLDQVGLPRSALARYPHEFSGGQRQRIAIARALAVEPRLIICDEPTSALDVSVQAQILNLLRELQSRLGLAYLFITHNLSVVEYLAHEVAVMYLGRIVEQGTVAEVLGSPRHPYTAGLLATRAHGGRLSGNRLSTIAGSPPDLANLPPGCAFAPRCKHAGESCLHEAPPVVAVGARHEARCVLLKTAA